MTLTQLSRSVFLLSEYTIFLPYCKKPCKHVYKAAQLAHDMITYPCPDIDGEVEAVDDEALGADDRAELPDADVRAGEGAVGHVKDDQALQGHNSKEKLKYK